MVRGVEGEWETEQVITCSYSICPEIHSADVLSILCPAALSGRREDICFLHPSSLIHKATSVSLHSAPSRPSSSLLLLLLLSAEATQACSGSTGKCGYCYGGGDGISSILMPQLHIMFNSRMVPTSLPHCGYHQLCRARKWLDECVMTHPYTHTLSQPARVYGKVLGVSHLYWGKSFNSFELRFGFWCSALPRPVDTHTLTS